MERLGLLARILFNSAEALITASRFGCTSFIDFSMSPTLRDLITIETILFISPGTPRRESLSLILLEGNRRARMQRYPHSNEPEETMKVELWVEVTPSWSPVTWIPMKRVPEGFEAKGRGLEKTKPNETQTSGYV